MHKKQWKKLLAFVSGAVNEELLLRNEYLVAENGILRKQIEGRLKLSNTDRITLARIGRKLGAKILQEVANLVKPDRQEKSLRLSLGRRNPSGQKTRTWLRCWEIANDAMGSTSGHARVKMAI